MSTQNDDKELRNRLEKLRLHGMLTHKDDSGFEYWTLPKEKIDLILRLVAARDQKRDEAARQWGLKQRIDELRQVVDQFGDLSLVEHGEGEVYSLSGRIAELEQELE